MGEPIETFEPSRQQLVLGWSPPGPDNAARDLGTGVTRDLDLYALEPFTSPRDRIIVPGQGLYEVIGWPENFSNGPYRGPGGYRINLRKVEG